MEFRIGIKTTVSETGQVGDLGHTNYPVFARPDVIFAVIPVSDLHRPDYEHPAAHRNRKTRITEIGLNSYKQKHYPYNSDGCRNNRLNQGELRGFAEAAWPSLGGAPWMTMFPENVKAG